MGATIAQGSIAERRHLKRGYIDMHRLWCQEAYADGCPGSVVVQVLCKDGESVSMKPTTEYEKCSVCERYLLTQFRYKLVAAIPPDVPHLPNPNAGKSGTEIQQILVNRGE